MRKVLAVLLGVLLATGVMVCPSVFSQGTTGTEEISSMELSGEVVSVDIEKSLVVVKYLVDEANQTYEEMTFKVDASIAAIEKGEKTVSLSDLKSADKVTVKYTVDDKGNNIVESIMVEGNSGM